MTRSSTRAKSGRQDLKLEDFRTTAEAGLALPTLILGVEVDPRSFGSDYPPRQPRFKAGRQWLNLIHDTAGAAHKLRYLMATTLAPHPGGGPSHV